MKTCIRQSEAVQHSRNGLNGWYYQLPEIEGGRSVIYAEVTGVHGERIIGEHPRNYYVIDGTGTYQINGHALDVTKGDLVTIPPFATYDFHATSSVLKVLLIMELLDLSLLPKSK
jgi:quercetin dioxygenase-like cupin family protein